MRSEAVLQNRTLICREGGRRFVFPAGERECYQSRGLVDDRGAAECRRARKQEPGGGGRGGYLYPLACACSEETA